MSSIFKTKGVSARGLLALAAGFALASAPAWAAPDEDYHLPGDVLPLRLGVYPPVQVPVPWFGYTEETAWDTYRVWGLDVGCVWCESVELYGAGVGGFMRTSGDLYGLQVAVWGCAKTTMRGLQVGGVAWANDAAGVQVGLVNWTRWASGVQIGLLNVSDDFSGVQIGLFNVVGGSLALPIVNTRF